MQAADNSVLPELGAVPDSPDHVTRGSRGIAVFMPAEESALNRQTLFSIWFFSVVLVVIVALVALRIQQRQEWFRLQAAQVATFTSLEQFPPKGLDHQSWRSTIDTPINVWVNATYHPDYSNISNAEMKSLLDQIQAIASAATCENSIHSVDDVLSLLAERDHMKAFVVGFREEFRSRFPQHFQLVQ